MNREQLLDQAKEIVTKHRQSQYGTPEDNFGTIALMWGAYLGRELSKGDVAYLMILLKIARGKHKQEFADNWLDVAGYAACGAEVSVPKEGE